jgi:molybdenum cofactor biosynthesis protein B
MAVAQHKADAPRRVRIGVVCISTSRTLAEDHSGAWMAERAQALGHAVVCRELAADDRRAILETVQGAIAAHRPQVMLLTGGTGISPSDLTIETLRPLFTKELSAFGPLFSQLSFAEIGSAALLSRATAGILSATLLFALPGSLKACQLACRELIFPELGHLVRHLHEG